MFLKLWEKKGPPPETLFKQESLIKEARMLLLSQNVIKIRRYRPKHTRENRREHGPKHHTEFTETVFLENEGTFFSPGLKEMVTSKE